jgi:hypothetical protein
VSLKRGYGEADYLLFADRLAVGAIEAKPQGTTLTGVETQSARYGDGLPDKFSAPVRPLPFLYESTGVETFFTNRLDPEPRSRPVFTFHRPETLSEAKTSIRRQGGSGNRRKPEAGGAVAAGDPAAGVRGEAGRAGPERRAGERAVGADSGGAGGEFGGRSGREAGAAVAERDFAVAVSWLRARDKVCSG